MPDPRAKTTKIGPLAVASVLLMVVLLCLGWQGNHLLAQWRPPRPAVAARGMDAGVTSAPAPVWDRGSPISAAIAARELEPGMIDLGDGVGPPIPSCRAPHVRVPATEGCADGETYPACKWRMPESSRVGHILSRWRNTGLEHWWGRPALVAVILAAARGYAERYPGEQLVVGDLDAAGPRHETHDHGVDVDLYLPGDMESENPGTGDYPSNYVDHPDFGVRMRRARVESLATILASCTAGQLRVYYNDRAVLEWFNHWFRRSGLESPFGAPMQLHNALHRFHFHLSIPADLPVLEGPIPEPPAAGGR